MPFFLVRPSWSCVIPAYLLPITALAPLESWPVHAWPATIIYSPCESRTTSTLLQYYSMTCARADTPRVHIDDLCSTCTSEKWKRLLHHDSGHAICKCLLNARLGTGCQHYYTRLPVIHSPSPPMSDRPLRRGLTFRTRYAVKTPDQCTMRLKFIHTLAPCSYIHSDPCFSMTWPFTTPSLLSLQSLRHYNINQYIHDISGQDLATRFLSRCRLSTMQACALSAFLTFWRKRKLSEAGDQEYIHHIES